MALGENIKRERMIPVRNKIVYRNLEQELAEMREREKNSAETPIFSTDDIALSLQQLNHFEEESSLPHNHFILDAADLGTRTFKEFLPKKSKQTGRDTKKFYVKEKKYKIFWSCYPKIRKKRFY